LGILSSELFLREEALTRRPATVRQKKLISYINRKLNVNEKLSREILQSIRTFEEADQYIKKYLPIVKFKSLRTFEILEVYRYLVKKTEKLYEFFDFLIKDERGT